MFELLVIVVLITLSDGESWSVKSEFMEANPVLKVNQVLAEVGSTLIWSRANNETDLAFWYNGLANIIDGM